MKKIILLWCIVLGACVYGCVYKKYDDIKPKNVTSKIVSLPCDSANPVISYSQHIEPIMEAECGSKNSCHNTAGAGGEIILEDYNGVSYAAATGQLMSCIVWDGSTKLMPEDSNTKIDACYIAEIQKWVDAGFPNN
ncbi:MAG TPA: hypothetical protein VNB90_12290 [Cytophagaceae bacterium]|nr:hypothetical protein [Cytophagaceae bacterium]